MKTFTNKCNHLQKYHARLKCPFDLSPYKQGKQKRVEKRSTLRL